jgi:hypothetical protein
VTKPVRIQHPHTREANSFGNDASVAMAMRLNSKCHGYVDTLWHRHEVLDGDNAFKPNPLPTDAKRWLPREIIRMRGISMMLNTAKQGIQTKVEMDMLVLSLARLAVTSIRSLRTLITQYLVLPKWALQVGPFAKSNCWLNSQFYRASQQEGLSTAYPQPDLCSLA